MRLQTRLIGAFIAVALIALVNAAVGFWQVNRLGSALYEIGAVRLPSLQGLATMHEAIATIDQTEHELLRPSADSIERRAALERLRTGWSSFDAGWQQYAALPQTDEEHAAWLAYERSATLWRASIDSLERRLLAPGAAASIATDTAQLGRAVERLRHSVDSSLATLVRINVSITDEAKAGSIANRADMRRVQAIALAGAILTVALALGLAIVMGRRFSRPMVQVARALDQVSGGQRAVRVDEGGDQEMLGMARAMNRMVDTLQQSEARFRSALLHSPIGIAVVGLDGRWLEVNPALCALAGRTREEMLASSFQSITHPDDLVADLEMLQKGIDGACDAWEREKRYSRPDGSIVWVQLNVSVVRGDDGAALHFVSQMQDVTTRRATELSQQALNARHARFEHAMATLTRMDMDHAEAIPRVLAQFAEVVADATQVQRVSIWRLEEAAMRLRRIEGFDRETREHLPDADILLARYRELLDRNFLQLDVVAVEDPASDPRMAQFNREVLIPLGVTAYLRAHIRSHGRIVGSLVLSESSGPRPWTPDEQTFAVSVSNLISARLEHAERLRAESQVRQAEKMNAVGQLAGGVAHDFNNLLTVINGCSELLASSRGSDPTMDAELVTAIRDAGARATALTRQLLLFSRKATFEPRVIEINETLGGTVRMLQRLIGEDIVLHADLPAGVRPVVVDPGQLEQVVMNLVVNARDAMAQGGQLSISTSNVDYDEAWCATHPGDRPGAFVRLTVRDTGVGMTPEVLSHIFEPFFTTKEAGKGTGLGLATVYGIATQSGGFVNVESVVGVGSAFHVHLPALVTPPANALEEADTSRGERTGHETILLVEDDREVRNVARRILTSYGYTVLEAASGTEAIDVLAHYDQPVHLMLTDVVMPGLSGRETYEVLAESRPELKVIFMSGYNDDSIVRHGVAGVRATVVAKPFSAATLTQALREVLDRA